MRLFEQFVLYGDAHILPLQVVLQLREVGYIRLKTLPVRTGGGFYAFQFERQLERSDFRVSRVLQQPVSALNVGEYYAGHSAYQGTE